MLLAPAVGSLMVGLLDVPGDDGSLSKSCGSRCSQMLEWWGGTSVSSMEGRGLGGVGILSDALVKDSVDVQASLGRCLERHTHRERK